MALPSLAAVRAFAAGLPARIVDMDARVLSDAIRLRQVGCVEVMEAYLAHIRLHNPVYNAIVGMAEEDGLIGQARDADRLLARGEYRGWLHGMPYAVKDLVPVQGLPFTSGSPIFADRIADGDAPFVARLRNAGAIFVGKTNSPEFGLGSQTYNPVYGSTASAWNPALTAGGSSGGAASGLGTHMLPVADGSDAMGSLRNPGAFNNVIGFRPSAGSLSDEPSTARPLSSNGPMGRNTADAIQLLQTMSPRPLAGPFNPADLRGLRIGWLGDLDGHLAMESGILDLCQASLGNLGREGVIVSPVRPRLDMNDVWLSWTALRHAGRQGMRGYYDNPQTRPLLKPELAWEVEQMLAQTESDRQHANRLREDCYAELERLFGEHDLLAIPTAQVFPYAKHVHWPEYIGERKMDTYHRWMEVVVLASLGGLPVINVPVGFDPSGRPMGMQVMGAYGNDRRVLEFGLAYEQVTDLLARRPRLFTP